jgi:hypothetical protein
VPLLQFDIARLTKGGIKANTQGPQGPIGGSSDPSGDMLARELPHILTAPASHSPKTPLQTSSTAPLPLNERLLVAQCCPRSRSSSALLFVGGTITTEKAHAALKGLPLFFHESRDNTLAVRIDWKNRNTNPNPSNKCGTKQTPG